MDIAYMVAVRNPDPAIFSDADLVAVALRHDAIAHLKWLNEKYIKASSLDDTLDKVISVAADAYRQKDKLGLIIKPITPSANADKTIPVKIRQTAIAHLKWLDEKFIHAPSLDDALDNAISLAAFIYERISKGDIIIKEERKSPFSGIN